VLAGTVRPAVAQPGAMIAELRVEEEGVAVSDPAILALIETRVGEPLSMADLRLSEDHLDALSRVETWDVLSEPVPGGGIRLTYRLMPAHPIDRFEFEGTPGLDADFLHRTIRDGFGTSPLPVARVGQVIDLLRQVYLELGYPSVRIEPLEAVQRHEPHHRSTVVIRVEGATRVRLARVEWNEEDAGARVPGADRPDMREGRPYDLVEIRRRLQRYVDELRERGYYEAFAEEPATRFQPEGAAVTLSVRRGPLVRVEFTGDRLTQDERERLVPVRAEASVDEDLLENWGLAIENYLRARGYRDAEAPHTSSPPDAPQMTITFDVRQGPLYVIDGVLLSGAASRPQEELREELGLETGAPFVEAALDAGAAQIEASYRALGFTRADVESSSAVISPERPDETRRVAVTLRIAEGPRTLVRTVRFDGNDALDEATLQALMPLAAGVPLSLRALADGVAAVIVEYRDRGYEGVTVEPIIERFESDTRADITIPVREGPRVFIDRIIIEGNDRTSRDTIARGLLLQEGSPLGYTARIESRVRLIELGLFRRVQILDRPHTGDTRRDLVVRVEEALPTTIGYGGGLEISSRLRPTGEGGTAEERIELVPRGFFEIGRRNMWGKNRSVSLFTRISARARDTLSDAGVLDTSYGVNEYRVYGTFREPRLFGSLADVVVTGIAERAIRTSYSFVTREVRAEVGGRLSADYSGAVRFSIQRTRLFDVDPNLSLEERPLIDRLFPQVRLSAVSGTLIHSTRDDDLDPSRGMFVSADGELAARGLGSEVGYLKGFIQGSWYRQLPAERRMVLAVRAVLGAAHGFRREVPLLDEDGNPVTDPGGAPLTQVVQDLPASERFFAGGSTSNRGFATDRLGSPETISPGGFPTGGNGELLLNSELRVGLFRALAGVVFVDVGNVFKRAADLSLTGLRPAAGFGFHYRVPRVGSLRAEVGFNLDRRELTPGVRERGNVLHVSLGPAF
jgi:outer membrane protein insertion porin family